MLGILFLLLFLHCYLVSIAAHQERSVWSNTAAVELRRLRRLTERGRHLCARTTGQGQERILRPVCKSAAATWQNVSAV